MNEKTIIEINGVKLEVDLRTATRVDTLAVGDRVRVLVKQEYSQESKVYPGVVVGFEPFQELPTVILAYMDLTYSGVELKFVYFNKAIKGVEVIKSIDNDELDLDKVKMTDVFDRDIQKKRDELDALEKRKAFFLSEFRKYWEFTAVTAA